MLEFKPSTTQLKFLEALEHIVFFGGGAGGGKTWAILVDNLQGVHDSSYFSVFFRTTTTEIDKGLWPEAKLMYMSLLRDSNDKYIGKSHINEQTKTITFPSGARTAFSYLQNDKDADAWYGTEITKIYFDEFQFRTQYQFDLLRSRNRSRAKVTKGIRCTLNPDDRHFVYDWVKPFLDDEGFPIPELGSKTRYYVLVNGVLYTDWSYDALYQKFYDPKLEDKKQKKPRTYTYIPSLLEENAVLMENDPAYWDDLNSMPERKRKQLLMGCWHSSEDSGKYFKREWVLGATNERAVCLEDIPLKSICMRALDKAYVAPHEGNKRPNYSAFSPKIYKTPDGTYILVGDYIDDTKDKKTQWDRDEPVYGRIRRTPGGRDTVTVRQAKHDGKNCTFVIAKDNAGNVSDFNSTASKLIEAGITVKKDQTINNQKEKKLKDFEPFINAAELGLIFIAIDTWDKDTLEKYLKELEDFDIEKKSTSYRFDDWVDATSMCFNAISKKRAINIVPRNQISSKAVAADRLSRINPLQT